MSDRLSRSVKNLPKLRELRDSAVNNLFHEKPKPMKLRLTKLIPFIMIFALAVSSFAADDIITLESGLRHQDLVVGTGETAIIGKVATIHIAGWLDHSGQKGTKFIDSHEQRQTITFKLGTDRVMKAWNFGVTGMKAGGKRRLMVPAALGYGSRGVEDIVPPDSDLILEIELVEIRQ